MSIYSKEHISTMLSIIISEIEGISEDNLRVNPCPDSSESELMYHYKVMHHESNDIWYKEVIKLSDILVYLFTHRGN